MVIRGIKDIKFNSNPIQAPNHEDEEIESMDPSSNENKKNKEEIGKIIWKREI